MNLLTDKIFYTYPVDKNNPYALLLISLIFFLGKNKNQRHIIVDPFSNSKSDNNDLIYWLNNQNEKFSLDEYDTDTLKLSKILISKLTTAEFPILTCDCGRVEMIIKDENQLSPRKKPYSTIENGLCVFCKKSPKLQKSACLIIVLGKNNLLVKDLKTIEPHCVRKETQNMIDILSGSIILISRTRNTGYKIKIFDKEWNIDPDIVNLDIIFQNYQNETNKTVYVTSRKSLKRISLLYLIYKVLPLHIVVPKFKSDLNLKDFNYSDILLLFLQCVSWKNNSCTISKSLLENIKKLDCLMFIKNIDKDLAIKNIHDAVNLNQILFNKIKNVKK